MVIKRTFLHIYFGVWQLRLLDVGLRFKSFVTRQVYKESYKRVSWFDCWKGLSIKGEGYITL